MADIEILAFDNALRPVNLDGDGGIVNGVGAAEPPVVGRQQGHDAEALDQVVFQADQEHGGTGIALASGAAPQLIIDPAALVLVGADDVQASQRDHLFAVYRRIAAQQDVGAASGHVGGDGDGPQRARLRYDLGFLPVVAGVQDPVGDASRREGPAQPLRFRDAGGAYQNGPPGAVNRADFGHQRGLLRGPMGEDNVGVIGADIGTVGRNHRDFQSVNPAQFLGLRGCGGGHPGHFGVQADQILQRDGSQNPPLALQRHAFLGLQRGLQPVRPAAVGGDASLELVHHFDLAVLHHVIHVAPQQFLGVDGMVQSNQEREIFRVIKVAAAQRRLGSSGAMRGQVDVAGVFVGRVVGARLKLPREHGHAMRQVLGGGGGARDHQGNARFVDQDGIGFVDQREVEVALDQIGRIVTQMVAQQIEADFVGGGVGDVGVVGAPPVIKGHVLGHVRHRKPQQPVHSAHPFRIAPGQVIIHRQHMDALAGEGI